MTLRSFAGIGHTVWEFTDRWGWRYQLFHVHNSSILGIYFRLPGSTGMWEYHGSRGLGARPASDVAEDIHSEFTTPWPEDTTP